MHNVIIFHYFNEYMSPVIAQLVERRTVVVTIRQISLGHWFDSGSRESIFGYFYYNKKYLSIFDYSFPNTNV